MIGMDDFNLRNMRALLGGDPDHKIVKLLSFCGTGEDIADPWYTGNFDETYRDVLRGCEGLLRTLARGLNALHNLSKEMFLWQRKI